MRNIKKITQYALLAIFTAVTLTGAYPTLEAAHAKPAPDTMSTKPDEPPRCKGAKVLTFPTWYEGMPGTCENPQIKKLNDVWIIVMNFIEILLQAVAYGATFYIIWGGFKYIKSEGDPAKISEAKSAIMNAVIGLAIALGSVAIIQFIQESIIQS